MNIYLDIHKKNKQKLAPANNIKRVFDSLLISYTKRNIKLNKKLNKELEYSLINDI